MSEWERERERGRERMMGKKNQMKTEYVIFTICHVLTHFSKQERPSDKQKWLKGAYVAERGLPIEPSTWALAQLIVLLFFY